MSPLLMAKGKTLSLVFDEYNGNLLPISMSIQTDKNVQKVLSNDEISDILKENKIEYSKIEYFILPTLNDSVISAYIQTATEEYIIIIDNTLNVSSLEIAHPYTISELKDLITE